MNLKQYYESGLIEIRTGHFTVWKKYVHTLNYSGISVLNNSMCEQGLRYSLVSLGLYLQGVLWGGGFSLQFKFKME